MSRMTPDEYAQWRYTMNLRRRQIQAADDLARDQWWIFVRYAVAALIVCVACLLALRWGDPAAPRPVHTHPHVTSEGGR